MFYNSFDDVCSGLNKGMKFKFVTSNMKKSQNISANQRSGRPSFFFDRPEKHKLGRGHWDLASCEVSLNSVHRGFKEEVENVSANQRPERPSCFFDRLQKHKLGRGRWDLAICQVSLNSDQWFQRRSRKCEKLTMTVDGGTTHDHNSALEPLAQVH